MTKRFVLYQNKNPPQRSCLSGRESIQRDEKRQQRGKRDHFKRRCDRLTFRPFPDPGDHLLCANDGCLVKHLPEFVRLQSNDVLYQLLLSCFCVSLDAGLHLRVCGKCAEMNPQNGELQQRWLELLHGSIPFIRDAVRLMKM